MLLDGTHFAQHRLKKRGAPLMKAGIQNRSMSSIKRDVKKKVLPRPESRFVFRDPAHFPSASLQGFCLLILISFSATGGNSIELRERQASVVDCVNRACGPCGLSLRPPTCSQEWQQVSSRSPGSRA